MQYFVIANDGNQYGPAPVDTLEQWAAEGRIAPGTMLRDATNGQTVAASSILRSFAAVGAAAPVSAPPAYAAAPLYNAPRQDYSQPPSQYTSSAYQRPTYSDSGVFWGVAIRCVLALVFFFFLHGIGLIFGGYALFYAIRAHGNGHRHGAIMIGIAGATFAILVVGWATRLGGLSPF